MSALYFIANDEYYYKLAENLGDIDKLEEIKKISGMNYFGKEEGRINKLIVSPTQKEIKKYLSKVNVAFIGWDTPRDKDRDVLVVKELPSISKDDDIVESKMLTTQEIRFDVDLSTSLSTKLQLIVKDVNNTFDELAGAEQMKKYFKGMQIAYEKGQIEKLTVFLLGVPGAGKTYLAECIAGEFDYKLIQLNLSLLMHLNNPIRKLHQFFQYLEVLAKQDIYVVALLDEIANMLKSDDSLTNQFKGQLLTILEDLNSERGYFIGKSIIIATENNIRKIITETPQFMARWIGKFFIHFPRKEESIEMIDMYLKKKKLDDFDAKNVWNIVSQVFRKSAIEENIKENRFIYSPREIKNFCTDLSIFMNSKSGNLTNDDIREVAFLCVPQQISLRREISEMINDSNSGFRVI